MHMRGTRRIGTGERAEQTQMSGQSSEERSLPRIVSPIKLCRIIVGRMVPRYSDCASKRIKTDSKTGVR
jgi:hypothetical protein